MTEITDQLRSLADGYTNAWCSQDAASVASFYSTDGSLTINDGPPAVGRAAIAQAALGFMTSFPDMKIFMDDLTSDGDFVLYYWTFQGTNTGPGGTGKKVLFSGFEKWRISNDGLIAESKGQFDTAVYQKQIEHGVDDPM
jgi:predicted ester cyclase